MLQIYFLPFFSLLDCDVLSVIFCKDSPLSMRRLGNLMQFPCVLCKISWQFPSGFRAIVIFSLKWLLLCIVTSYQCTSLFRKALWRCGWQVVNFIVSAQETRGLNQKTVIKKAAKFSWMTRLTWLCWQRVQNLVSQLHRLSFVRSILVNTAHWEIFNTKS